MGVLTFVVSAVIFYFVMIMFLPIRVAQTLHQAVKSDWAVVIIAAVVIYLLVQS